MSDNPTGAGEPPREPVRQKGQHTVVWLGLAMKIFQSGKALKVVLAGVAVSGWTVLYSLPFALAVTATLVFHEWGHLRAMRRFGIPTKGMYLIPFVGGIAVGEQAKTHWQDVYISMMGPVYGLAMTVACYLLYLATSSHLVGLVASVSALVNVFNLAADPSARRRPRGQGPGVLGAQPLGVRRAHRVIRRVLRGLVDAGARAADVLHRHRGARPAVQLAAGRGRPESAAQPLRDLVLLDVV